MKTCAITVISRRKCVPVEFCTLPWNLHWPFETPSKTVHKMLVNSAWHNFADFGQRLQNEQFFFSIGQLSLFLFSFCFKTITQTKSNGAST